MTKAPLRAVREGEGAAARAKKSVVEAAASGSRRDLLVSMRERVAKTVDNPACPPRDLASLTLRLEKIAAEIEAIDLRAIEEARESAVSPDEEWDAEAL